MSEHPPYRVGSTPTTLPPGVVRLRKTKQNTGVSRKAGILLSVSNRGRFSPLAVAAAAAGGGGVAATTRRGGRHTHHTYTCIAYLLGPDDTSV